MDKGQIERLKRKRKSRSSTIYYRAARVWRNGGNRMNTIAFSCQRHIQLNVVKRAWESQWPRGRKVMVWVGLVKYDKHRNVGIKLSSIFIDTLKRKNISFVNINIFCNLFEISRFSRNFNFNVFLKFILSNIWSLIES